MNRQRNRSNILFWTIYLALLAVLLPHTAWAFAHFEPRDASWQGVSWGMVTAWAAAFAFEAAIAALTHKIAKHIDSTLHGRSCLAPANIPSIPKRRQ